MNKLKATLGFREDEGTKEIIEGLVYGAILVIVIGSFLLGFILPF